MPKIIPHLWFDKDAQAIAKFYTSIFPNTKIKDLNSLENTPSGTVEMMTMEIMGQEFFILTAGPIFKFNPSISFLVYCKTTEEVDALWAGLSPGGKSLMELGEYPFSKKYGWLEDKYGLSWQIMHAGDRPVTQRIIPTLMFVGNVCGKAEEAINFYSTIFNEAKINDIMRYEKGESLDQAGTIKHASFSLEGQQFAAMDSAYKHEFSFNEAISLLVYCKDQAEIDYFWEKLSAVPEAEQCGWLKDKYGISWQIVPTQMNEMFKEKDQEKLARVTQAFLKMKKFDLATLQKAYEGRH